MACGGRMKARAGGGPLGNAQGVNNAFAQPGAKQGDSRGNRMNYQVKQAGVPQSEWALPQGNYDQAENFANLQKGTGNVMNWLGQYNPQLYGSMQNMAQTQQTPNYTYNPQTIGGEWLQNLYSPAVTAANANWQYNTLPAMQEQFVRSGNTLGGVMPSALTKNYGNMMTNLNQTLAQQLAGMLSEGRQLGVQAGDTAAQRQLAQNQALISALTGASAMPGAVAQTDAQTQQALASAAQARANAAIAERQAGLPLALFV